MTGIRKKWRVRATRPPSKPLPTATLVDPLFKWLKLDESARSFAAMRAFSLAVGPRIRERARAERLRGAILFVRVASSAWSHELTALRAQLVDKIRRTPGGEGVEDLRFNVGPLDELPDWSEPPPSRAPSREVAAAEPEGEVARALDAVADEELRAELSRLYARLGRPPRAPR